MTERKTETRGMDEGSVMERLGRAMHEARGAYGDYDTGDCRCRFDANDWLAALSESTDEGLRTAGDGYEIQTWVRHEPSGLVVLKGHPQLGGRYCMTDGGDWPCASVRAALAATLPEPGEGL